MLHVVLYMPLFSCFLNSLLGSSHYFLGKTGWAKIIAHLTNSNPLKKHFFNQPIRFPGSNLDSGEINSNVIGLACSKDLATSTRGLLLTSTTRFDAPRHWRARRPLASRVNPWSIFVKMTSLCLLEDPFPIF